ncbi:MAG: hypothetical protein AB8G15_07565 [Saprospiraceae bacterium]
MSDDILDENIFDKAEQYHETDFAFFRDYHSIADAKLFTTILEAHKIPYLAAGAETVIDEAIVGSGLMPKVILKIRPEDFAKINAIIAEQITSGTENFSDHYLQEFTNEELKDIFARPDEWSVEDFNIAKLVLQQRGVKITDAAIQNLREERLTEIRAGKKGSYFWMSLYFIGIIVGAYFGVMYIIAGIGMGYYYGYGKSTDPDGVRHFVYDAQTRTYGKVILYVGSLLFFAELIILATQ